MDGQRTDRQTESLVSNIGLLQFFFSFLPFITHTFIGVNFVTNFLSVSHFLYEMIYILSSIFCSFHLSNNIAAAISPVLICCVFLQCDRRLKLLQPLCWMAGFSSKCLPPIILLNILSFVTRTSCFCKFDKYLMREIGVSRPQYALLFLTL